MVAILVNIFLKITDNMKWTNELLGKVILAILKALVDYFDDGKLNSSTPLHKD